MKREALVSLLTAHSPTDEKERADLDAMRAFATSLEAPFSRAQQPAHFTASAFIVDAERSRICLVHHAKLNRWLQPGGHIEASDVDVVSAAMREAREETGLEVSLATGPQPFDVDVHTIPAKKTEPAHQHLDVRFLLVGTGTLAHDPNESHGAQWVSFEEAFRMADEAPLRRMIEKAVGLA